MNNKKIMLLSCIIIYTNSAFPSAPALPFRENTQDQTFIQYQDQEKANLVHENTDLRSQLSFAESRKQSLKSQLELVIELNTSLEEQNNAYKKEAKKNQQTISKLIKDLAHCKSQLQSSSSQASATPKRYSWSPADQYQSEQAQRASAAALAAASSNPAGSSSHEVSTPPAAAGLPLFQIPYPDQQPSSARSTPMLAPSSRQLYNEQLSISQQLEAAEQSRSKKRRRSESAPIPKSSPIEEDDEQ